MAQLKGGTYVGGDLTVATDIYTNTLKVFVPTGTAPITVNSTTLVNNLNVEYLSGKKLAVGNNGMTWDAIPYVKSDGVLEIGHIIDFHTGSSGAEDYVVRAQAYSGMLDVIARINARGNSQGVDYLNMALMTQSFDGGNTGIGFHISGNVGKPLYMDTAGNLNWSGNRIVDSQYNSTLPTDSRNSRGVTRLFRSDADTNTSLQFNSWNGSTWRLYGYTGDTEHGGVRVSYADTAGTASPSNDSNLVHISGAETITGEKTFNSGLVIGEGRSLTNNATATRDKLRVWTDSNYTIGMTSGFTYGGLENDYAMTFQMNPQSTRGFWWGYSTQNNAQGAMALTTDGKLTVSTSIRMGYSENDTTIPTSNMLDIKGDVKISDGTNSASMKYNTSSKTLDFIFA